MNQGKREVWAKGKKNENEIRVDLLLKKKHGKSFLADSIEDKGISHNNYITGTACSISLLILISLKKNLLNAGTYL